MSETTVAIVQQPPSVLDLRTGITRAAQYVAEAAEGGAALVVFPETWLTCYPAWVFGLAGWRDPVAQRWYAELLCHSVVLDDNGGLDDDLGPVREAAREAGVTVGLGVTNARMKRAVRCTTASFSSAPTGTPSMCTES